jgi:hypothetical protein
VVVDRVGEFRQTDDVVPTLAWTWLDDGSTVVLLPISMLVEDLHLGVRNRKLDLRAVISPSELLFTDRHSRTVWHARRDGVVKAGAHLDRPPDLDNGLVRMKFRVSPNGRWIVCFTESGLAAFHDFQAKMIEDYDELLWEPCDISDDAVTIDHYELGTRYVAFLP